MSNAFRKMVTRVVPRSVIEWGKRQVNARVLAEAAEVLRHAPATPEWLDASMFAPLMAEYPVLRTPLAIAADPQPDFARAAIVLEHLGSAQEILEVGAGPGLVSWAAALAGRVVTALDLTDPLAPEAAAAGVQGFKGDACRLPFEADRFDGLWSFNAYEHIHTPPDALAEAWRVVRPGGRIHLNFAPLYNAPLGLHAFREIGVPFCQHLWSEPQLQSVVKSEGFWFLNYWPLAKYRQMWADFLPRLRPVSVVEERDYQGIELVARYPGCFAKRSRDLDEFTVSKIVATFEVVK